MLLGNKLALTDDLRLSLRTPRGSVTTTSSALCTSMLSLVLALDVVTLVPGVAGEGGCRRGEGGVGRGGIGCGDFGTWGSRRGESGGEGGVGRGGVGCGDFGTWGSRRGESGGEGGVERGGVGRGHFGAWGSGRGKIEMVKWRIG